MDAITALLPLEDEGTVNYTTPSFGVQSQRTISDSGNHTAGFLPSQTNNSISARFSSGAGPINIGFSYYTTVALFPSDVQSVSSVIGAIVNTSLTANLSIAIQLEANITEVPVTI